MSINELCNNRQSYIIDSDLNRRAVVSEPIDYSAGQYPEFTRGLVNDSDNGILDVLNHKPTKFDDYTAAIKRSQPEVEHYIPYDNISVKNIDDIEEKSIVDGLLIQNAGVNVREFPQYDGTIQGNAEAADWGLLICKISNEYEGDAHRPSRVVHYGNTCFFNLIVTHHDNVPMVIHSVNNKLTKNSFVKKSNHSILDLQNRNGRFFTATVIYDFGKFKHLKSYFDMLKKLIASDDYYTGGVTKIIFDKAIAIYNVYAKEQEELDRLPRFNGYPRAANNENENLIVSATITIPEDTFKAGGDIRANTYFYNELGINIQIDFDGCEFKSNFNNSTYIYKPHPSAPNISDFTRFNNLVNVNSYTGKFFRIVDSSAPSLSVKYILIGKEVIKARVTQGSGIEPDGIYITTIDRHEYFGHLQLCADHDAKYDEKNKQFLTDGKTEFFELSKLEELGFFNTEKEARAFGDSEIRKAMANVSIQESKVEMTNSEKEFKLKFLRLEQSHIELKQAHEREMREHEAEMNKLKRDNFMLENEQKELQREHEKEMNLLKQENLKLEYAQNELQREHDLEVNKLRLKAELDNTKSKYIGYLSTALAAIFGFLTKYMFTKR